MAKKSKNQKKKNSMLSSSGQKKTPEKSEPKSMGQNSKTQIFSDKRFSKITTDHRFQPEKVTNNGVGSKNKRFASLSKKLNMKSNLAHIKTDDSSSEDEELSDEDISNEVIPFDAAEVEAYSTGIKQLESDSSDDDEDESHSSDFDRHDVEWEELDRDAKWDTEENDVEETERVAVCNMDWDNVNCNDLFALLTSFVPKGGFIKKVATYVSEFGKQRMEEEDKNGPLFLKDSEAFLANEESDEEDSDDSDIRAKRYTTLKAYQKERLKYYYAVVEFDSKETAVDVYKQCDRNYFEATGLLMDLRYIPSDMEFNEEPSSVCTSIPDDYEFVTPTHIDINTGLPKIAWDETDPKRTKALSQAASIKKNKMEFNEDLIQEYIGSGSSDEESEDETVKKEHKKKYRHIMSLVNEEEKTSKKVQLKDLIPLENSDQDQEEEIMNEEETDECEDKQTKKDDQNPFEKFLEERRLRLKKKKEMKKHKKIFGTAEENDNLLSDDDLPDDDLPFKKDKSKGDQKQSIEEQKVDPNLDLLMMDDGINTKEQLSTENIAIEATKIEKEDLDKFSNLWKSSNCSLDRNHPNYAEAEVVHNFLTGKRSTLEISGEPAKKKWKRRKF